MLNILHIDGETAPAAKADSLTPAADENAPAIKRNNAPEQDRPSANAIYDRARGIYFRARAVRPSKPTSIF